MDVDRWTEEFLEELQGKRRSPIHLSTTAEVRELSARVMATNGPGPDMHWIIDESVPSPGGFEVPVRVLVPVPRPRAVVIYHHGGGWVSGGIAESETIARKLAERTSSAFALVDYRLAPENPYPAAVQDSYAALEWVASHVDEIAGENVPVMVAGEDAGGNLAAMAALRARDTGGPAIAMQILVCPILQPSSNTSAPAELDARGWVGPEALKWYWDQYLPDDAARRSPEVTPLEARDLSGLPPTVLVAAEYSPARLGAEAYAKRLREAGVEVDAELYERQIHGFFDLLRLPQGERAFQQVIKAVRARWARESTGSEATSGTLGSK